MESFYVVGDIEDNDNAFNDAIECIKISHDKIIVFLGDIYTSVETSKSVAHIAEILWRLGIPVRKCIDESFINSDHTGDEIFRFCENIKKLFEQLYNYHRLDLYTSTNKLKNGYGFSKLIERDLQPKTRNSVFILGNKECNLIQDMHSLTETNIIDGKFVGNYKYVFQHKTYTSTVSFTLKELNILITYLYHSSHFFIYNETLLTHIYVSGRNLIKIAHLPNVRRIISGHSRCFGIYKDPANAKMEIVMMDMSHEDSGIIKNYLLVQGDNVLYFTNNPTVRKYLNNYVLSAKTTFLSSTPITSTLDFYMRCTSENDDYKEEQNDD